MSGFSIKAVSFSPNGIELAALVYLPDGAGRFPCVVMSHGFGALKEMGLTQTAELFAKAGYACILYDHRNFGESKGEIRQEINPWDQIKDMQGMITCAQTLENIDPQRIALWGTSFSAGEALIVAAIDKRIAAVVSQTPFVSGSRTLERMFNSEQFSNLRAQIYTDKTSLLGGGTPALVPISEEGSEGNLWAQRAGAGTAYRNEVTLQTFDYLQYCEPIDFVERIAPTPLLMIIATNDVRTPTDLQRECYEKARQPKELYEFEGGHYDVYQGKREACAIAAITFLNKYL